jgi:hypothetical protein
VWQIPFDKGVRPMAFDANPDGSIYTIPAKTRASVFGMSPIRILNLYIKPFGITIRPQLRDSWTSYSVSERDAVTLTSLLVVR